MRYRAILLCLVATSVSEWTVRGAAPGTKPPLAHARGHALPAPNAAAFIEKNCAGCHNDVDLEGNLDLASLAFNPSDRANFQSWIKVHDMVKSGEMPPKEKKRPEPGALATFVQGIAATLTNHEDEILVREGRATQRRLNGYEYEHILRDVFQAPWLQVKGQFPEDGEAHRFNKVGDALDVSHVHMSRYMTAADYAMRQVLGVELERPATKTTRYYARDQRTLTGKFSGSIFNSSPDRMTYPVIGTTPQPDVRMLTAPLTVGDADPAVRDQEAVGWVSSNYVTGFTYRWDQFRAPVAGRYRIRFSGYTLWCAPGGVAQRYANERDKKGTPRPPNPNVPNYDAIFPGRHEEPITVYTRNGIMNRRVGEFDLTPEPGVHDIGEVWLLANETLVPDASRFYRSRPNNFRNPLMTPEGVPSVAFRWMEVDGPIYDEATAAGYRLLFGNLPLRQMEQGKKGGMLIDVVARRAAEDTGRNAGQRVTRMEEVAVEVISARPREDAQRLLRTFVQRVYRRPITDADVERFVALFDNRTQAGLSFTEAMLASYTAVLASPGFVYLQEKPGPLDDHALATRLALFLWNSEPDAPLRKLAAQGQLHSPAALRAQTERMLQDPKSRRFVDAFLDYWIDARKIEDTTPSTSLYNDYYLDDALTEAALAETQLFFAEMLRVNLGARTIVDSDFTFLNDRLAVHYGVPDVKGIAMRRVNLPPGSPRGGLLTQATVLKVTANGTTTSPVLRGKWITERILGVDIPPPPAAVKAVDPDIRGAVTIRQQLEMHREDASCAVCHTKMDPPGFALESFDIMGAWREQYRAIAEKVPGEPEKVPPVKGLGKNGQPFEYHLALPVDSAGALPDGRAFKDVREFKRLLLDSEARVARNLAQQLVIYATGAPIRFSDRPALDRIVAGAQAQQYGVRTLVHEIVQSELFRNK